MKKEPKSTLSNIPINPRTGLPYHKGTKKYEEWYEGLSDTEKGIIADLEAQEAL